MAEELKQRHYDRVEGLAPRTRGDVSEGEVRKRAVEAFAAPGARPGAPSLISSFEGALERILLTVPNYAADGLAAAYTDLIGKLPAETRLVVLTHEGAEQTVRRWLADAGADQRSDVVIAPDHLHFSIWAEDGYCAARDGEDGRTYLIEPFSFPRYGDSLIADMVSNATDLRDTQAPLYFQGGNVLIGDRFFMIGADYPANSLEYLESHLQPDEGEQPEAFIRRLYSEYLDTGRSLIYVGSTIPVPTEAQRPITVGGQAWREVIHFGNRSGTVQPLFHIDMFVTLVGRDGDRFRVLVGDPSIAAEMLGRPLQPHAMAPVFDDIARGLEREGFEVIRNPLPLVYLDDEAARERVWYFATANNALVQNTGGADDTVWLPSYGHGAWPELARTDEVNARVWRDLGFNPVMLGDFHPFAENLGAVHCIKKYLARA